MNFCNEWNVFYTPWFCYRLFGTSKMKLKKYGSSTNLSCPVTSNIWLFWADFDTDLLCIIPPQNKYFFPAKPGTPTFDFRKLHISKWMSLSPSGLLIDELMIFKYPYNESDQEMTSNNTFIGETKPNTTK